MFAASYVAREAGDSPLVQGAVFQRERLFDHTRFLISAIERPWTVKAHEEHFHRSMRWIPGAMESLTDKKILVLGLLVALCFALAAIPRAIVSADTAQNKSVEGVPQAAVRDGLDIRLISHKHQT